MANLDNGWWEPTHVGADESTTVYWLKARITQLSKDLEFYQHAYKRVQDSQASMFKTLLGSQTDHVFYTDEHGDHIHPEWCQVCVIEELREELAEAKKTIKGLTA
jgi:hypothetical protein